MWRFALVLVALCVGSFASGWLIGRAQYRRRTRFPFPRPKK